MGWRRRGNRPGRSYRTDAGLASTSWRRMKSESPTLVIIRAQKAPTAVPPRMALRRRRRWTDATKPTLLTLIAPNLGSFSPRRRLPQRQSMLLPSFVLARCRRLRNLAVVTSVRRANPADTAAFHVAHSGRRYDQGERNTYKYRLSNDVV